MQILTMPKQQRFGYSNWELNVNCKKCGSNNVEMYKKGFNGSDACLGAALCGPIGLAAGGLDANAYDVICKNCGYVYEVEVQKNCCGGTSIKERSTCLIPLIIAGIGFASKAFAYFLSSQQ